MSTLVPYNPPDGDVFFQSREECIIFINVLAATHRILLSGVLWEWC